MVKTPWSVWPTGRQTCDFQQKGHCGNCRWRGNRCCKCPACTSCRSIVSAWEVTVSVLSSTSSPPDWCPLPVVSWSCDAPAWQQRQWVGHWPGCRMTPGRSLHSPGPRYSVVWAVSLHRNSTDSHSEVLHSISCTQIHTCSGLWCWALDFFSSSSILEISSDRSLVQPLPIVVPSFLH